MRRLLALLVIAALAVPVIGDAGPIWESMTPISQGAGDFPGWGDAADLEADGSLSADVINKAEIADVDWGPFTSTAGVYDMNDDVIVAEDIDFTNFSLADFVEQGTWKIFYSDGSGDVTELPLGTDGYFLMSNGPEEAPTFELPGGAGDITSIWQCASGDCSAMAATAGDSLDATDSDYAIPWVIETDCSAVVADGRACWESDANLLWVGHGSTTASVSNPFGASIGPTEMEAVDFGDFSCNGTVCAYDTDSIVAEDVDFLNFSLTDFTEQGTYKMFYSDSAGDVKELAFGDSGLFLKSLGTSLAWASPSGSGDVTGVGDCTDGDCLDGTSDGGTYVSLYDSGYYGKIQLTTLTASRTYTFPNATGTVILSNDFSPAADLDADGSLSTAAVQANEIDFTDVDLTDFVYQNPWRVFYSDGNGDVQELAFGDDGYVLTSTGTTSAPVFEAGAAVITGIGDCTEGDCFDGTSDGGTYLSWYDGDSNKTTVLSSNISGDIVVYLPEAGGTLMTDQTVAPYDAEYLVYSYDAGLDEEMLVQCNAGLSCMGVDNGGGDSNVFNIATDSTEADFLYDMGAGTLTCGASNEGKMAVSDDGTLQYCDGAATPALQQGLLANATNITWAMLLDAGLSDGDLLDLAGVSVTETGEGILLPRHATNCSAATQEGQVCWEVDDDVLYIGDGSGPIGMVSGPTSSTDHAVPRFDLATGKFLLNSSVLIDDSNNVTGVVGLQMTGKLDLADRIIFGDQDPTPSVAAGNVYTFNDTGANTVTDFDDGEIGQLLFISFNSSNTVIDFSTGGTGIIGNKGEDWYAQQNDHMVCFKIGSYWRCITDRATIHSIWNDAFGDVSALVAASGDSLNVSGGDYSLPFVNATDCSGHTAEGRCCWDTDNDVLYCGDSASAVQVGGGGGAPGGDDTEFQYNNGGAFGGANALVYNDTDELVGVGTVPDDEELEIGELAGTGPSLRLKDLDTSFAANAEMGRLQFAGIGPGGTEADPIVSAEIIAEAGAAWASGTNYATRMIFSVTPANATTQKDFMVIQPMAGGARLGVGTDITSYLPADAIFEVFDNGLDGNLAFFEQAGAQHTDIRIKSATNYDVAYVMTAGTKNWAMGVDAGDGYKFKICDTNSINGSYDFVTLDYTNDSIGFFEESPSTDVGFEISHTAGAMMSFKRWDSVTVADELLGGIYGRSIDGDTSPYNTPDTGAGIEFYAGDAWAVGDSPGYIVFKTTPDSSNTLTEVMRLSMTGAFSLIGTDANSVAYNVAAATKFRVLYADENGNVVVGDADKDNND